MSLMVYPFHRDPQTGSFLPDETCCNGTHFAGVESWRWNIWGSAAMRRHGATFLPQLRYGDLYIEHEELDAFEQELQTLMQQIDAISQSLTVRPDVILTRLENVRRVVDHAKQTGGGIYIG